MGMFKDMKDAMGVMRSDDLKQLRQQSAAAQPMGMGSLLDSVREANAALAPAAALAGGTPGTATVQAIAETGTEINNALVVDMDLLVQVPGSEPYPVRHRQPIAKIQIPHFQPGSSFPVRVDPADRTKVAMG